MIIKRVGEMLTVISADSLYHEISLGIKWLGITSEKNQSILPVRRLDYRGQFLTMVLRGKLLVWRLCGLADLFERWQRLHSFLELHTCIFSFFLLGAEEVFHGFAVGLQVLISRHRLFLVVIYT